VLVRQAIKRPGTLYAFVTDTREHAKQIAWERVLKVQCAQFVQSGGMHFVESELRAVFANGSEIALHGAELPYAERLRGSHFDGVVFDEYGLVAPTVWEQIVLPTLLRRNGTALFVGTPRGRNHFYHLYKKARDWPDWFVALIRADESGALSPEKLALARQQQTPEEYAAEYECSFETPIAGAYYAHELTEAHQAGRIRHVPYDPALLVETWWDLGFTDYTAIVFTQRIGREVHVIDYVEGKGHDLTFYAKALQERPYLYERHHVPHDAEGKHLSAAGETIAQQLRRMVRAFITVHPPDPSVLSAINQARLFFPRCWFDETRCERLLDALAAYHAKPDVKHGTDKPEPEHDWSSHGADAFRLLAVSTPLGVPQLTPPRPARMDFDMFNWDRPRRAARTAVLDFDPFAA
jgi:phage terminase large subunit